MKLKARHIFARAGHYIDRPAHEDQLGGGGIADQQPKRQRTVNTDAAPGLHCFAEQNLPFGVAHFHPRRVAGGNDQNTADGGRHAHAGGRSRKHRF